ncbi:MAG TPA: nucleotide pyrophosphohydrolase [Candidatus Limnocylindrales bacterium]|nr:nucleotide pyrophosphohydrolase [Candidatus Limnocylindrales bacterium]
MPPANRPSPRTLSDLQRELDAWIRSRGRYWSALSQYVRLVEEVGELGRELNHRFGDKPRTSKDTPRSIADELGDVLFIVVLLANSLEVDLSTALDDTLAKYEGRPA